MSKILLSFVKSSKLFTYSLCFVSFAISPLIAHAYEASVSAGYNPLPNVEKDVETTSVAASTQVGVWLNLAAAYRATLVDSEIDQGFSGRVEVGLQKNIHVAMAFQQSESDSYFPKQDATLRLMTRLSQSPIGGIYEYSEARYTFAVQRTINIQVGHYYDSEWLIAGVGAESYGSRIPEAYITIEKRDEALNVRDGFNLKLKLGKHFRLSNNSVVDPSFGLLIDLEGNKAISPALKHLKFLYQYNGSLLKRSYRTGLAIGLKYFF